MRLEGYLHEVGLVTKTQLKTKMLLNIIHKIVKSWFLIMSIYIYTQTLHECIVTTVKKNSSPVKGSG